MRIKHIGTLCALGALGVGVGCSTTSRPEYYTYSSQGSTRYAETSSTSEGAQSSTQAATESGGSTVIPLYEESVRVGTREVDAGSVRLRKVVTTETVNQPVQLRRETLVIDREPAGQSSQAAATLQPGAAPAQAFQEQETVIQLKREEPVIEKQIIQTGRIVAEKRAQPQQQSVQQQIRREEIKVEKIGNPENVVISENLRSSQAAGGTASGASQTQGAGASNTDTNNASGTP
jgi:stress response protein YsnF